VSTQTAIEPQQGWAKVGRRVGLGAGAGVVASLVMAMYAMIAAIHMMTGAAFGIMFAAIASATHLRGVAVIVAGAFMWRVARRDR